MAALAASAVGVAIAASPASAILYRIEPGHWVSYAARQGKPTPHTSPKSMRLSNGSNFEIFNGNDGYLNYSGGPVMPSSKNYVFVWNGSNYAGGPFGSGGNCGFADSSGNYNQPCSSYVNGVATYFQDLAAASGSSNNSNAVSTQYNDAAGHNVNYNVSFGGIINDTNPFPSNGCTGSPNVSGGRCLTDQQVQNELQSYLSSHGYPAGTTNEYFVLTPPDVASCFDAGGSVCSGNAGPGGTPYFCAYHSTSNTSSHYIYSNIPDMDDITGCDPFATTSPQGNTDCDPSFYTCVWPNGYADGVLSAVSHEHNESLTDPQPNNAWADWSGGPRPLGDENGDKCNADAGDDPNAVWAQNPNTFFEGTPYNETINGRHYYIQREWSNENMGCYSSYSGSPAPGASFVSQTVSGRTVSFDAGGSGGGIAQYVWQFNDGPGQTTTVKTASPTISHTFPRTGSYHVALTTMQGNGRSRGTARTVTVSPPKQTLTVSKSGTGAGQVASSPAGISCGPTCAHAYNQGTVVHLTATPASGSKFAGWSGGGCSGTGTCTVTMSSNRSVTATFSKITTTTKHKLTVSKAGTGAGSVTSSPTGISCGSTCSHNYNRGTAVTLTAHPASGSTFAHWGGACSGTGRCTVTMSANRTVTAFFNKKNPVSAGPPQTTITKARINKKRRKAKLVFAGSGGVGTLKFKCKLTGQSRKLKRWRNCSSPTVYKHLKKGRHLFQVEAIDSRGKVDATPAKKPFRI